MRSSVLLVVLTLLVAGPVLARPLDPQRGRGRTRQQPFPYSYIDAGYRSVEIEGFDEEPTGLLLRASYPISRSAVLTTAFIDVSGENIDGDQETNEKRIGVGLHRSLGGTFDIQVGGEYVQADADPAGLLPDDDGFAYNGTLRLWLGRRLELNAYAEHVDIGDGETFLGGRAVFYSSPRIGIFGEALFAEESEAELYTLGIRLAR